MRKLGITAHSTPKGANSMIKLPRMGASFIFTGVVLLVCLVATAGPDAKQNKSPQNNLVYEIFVRSFFYDGPENGKDIKKIGNLKGIVKKLDPYLNDGDPKTDHDLEVGVLWLMPIFPSPSYHGYDVTDFRA